MSFYDALTLMLMFGTLLLALLSYINDQHKK
ncbi:putative holin-like toxin [Weissella uvarum]|nr:putative holin-like toxin [Weissella uvarum]